MVTGKAKRKATQRRGERRGALRFPRAGPAFVNDKKFQISRDELRRAKVRPEVEGMAEFSGFACSEEQAKKRRKHGETRLQA